MLQQPQSFTLEHADGRQQAVRMLNTNNSPSSIVTTDDHEVFERIQESLAGGVNEWVDWSRGLDAEAG